MTIKNLLKLVVALLFVFMVISTVLIHTQLTEMQMDGTVINSTGVVRGGTQRLVKFELYGMPNDDLMNTIENLINSLINGNEASGLPKATDKDYLDAMNKIKTEYSKLKQGILEARQTGDYTYVIEKSEAFFELTNTAVTAAEVVSNSKVADLKSVQNILLVINVLLLMFILYINNYRVLKPLNELIQIIENLDVKNRISDKYLGKKDEIGELARAFEKVIGNIRVLVDNIVQTSGELLNSSGTLSSISHDVSQASMQVAKAIEEVAHGATEQAMEVQKGFEEMSLLGDLVKSDKERVSELEGATDEVNQLKDEGTAILSELIEKTKQNGKSAQEVQETILQTSQSTNNIIQASAMIRQIADQTNLLALNASIEAARAGEYGRGFAVVADEIRQLADDSNTFTAKIEEMTSTLSSKSNSAIEKMNQMEHFIKVQSESVVKTNEKFNGIIEAIEKMKVLIEGISTSTNSIATKNASSLEMIQKLATISENNAANTEEVSASVEEQTAAMDQIAYASNTLAELAKNLSTNVNKFK